MEGQDYRSTGCLKSSREIQDSAREMRCQASRSSNRACGPDIGSVVMTA